MEIIGGIDKERDVREITEACARKRDCATVGYCPWARNITTRVVVDN